MKYTLCWTIPREVVVEATNPTLARAMAGAPLGNKVSITWECPVCGSKNLTWDPCPNCHKLDWEY